MRVLLGCSLGGLGHLTPIAAAARALGRLGHESVVLVPPALSDAAREAGIRAHVGGEPPRSVIDGMWERVRAGPPEAVAGLMDRELFAGHCTDAMLDAAARLCDEWAPELAEPGYREAAQRIAGEITTTATLDEALCGYIDGGSTGRAFPNHPSATTSRRAHS